MPKGGSKTASFKNFEASTSDAWEINDASDPQFNALATAAVHDDKLQQVRKSPVNNTTPTKKALSQSSVINNGANARTPPPNAFNHQPEQPHSGSKVEKLERLLDCPNIDIDHLRQAAWSGLTRKGRSKAWKILCGYLPGTTARQGEVLQRKQEEYNQYVKQYFQTKDQDIHQETYRQIHIDIPRMSPVIGLFQQRCVQEIFERILYIWAIRHPASGYVQGINDLVTPFFLVFLENHCAPGTDLADVDVEKDLTKEQINEIEADSFWCLTKVLDGIQDNYTFAQPGIQLKVKQLEELVQRIDKDLHEHLVGQEVIYLQFAFRWMNNILMREIPIKATIRLWDTYLSEEGDGFSRFHLYVCAAFLIHWKAELLKKTDFHTLLMFLQNLPTAKWGDNEINLLVAEAFKLSYLFANAPKHLDSVKEKK